MWRKRCYTKLLCTRKECFKRNPFPADVLVNCHALPKLALISSFCQARCIGSLCAHNLMLIDWNSCSWWTKFAYLSLHKSSRLICIVSRRCVLQLRCPSACLAAVDRRYASVRRCCRTAGTGRKSCASDPSGHCHTPCFRCPGHSATPPPKGGRVHITAQNHQEERVRQCFSSRRLVNGSGGRRAATPGSCVSNERAPRKLPFRHGSGVCMEVAGACQPASS